MKINELHVHIVYNRNVKLTNVKLNLSVFIFMIFEAIVNYGLQI